MLFLLYKLSWLVSIYTHGMVPREWYFHSYNFKIYSLNLLVTEKKEEKKGRIIGLPCNLEDCVVNVTSVPKN